MSDTSDIGDKMYVQDENQHIVATWDEEFVWDKSYRCSQMWTLAVILPEIGALVAYEGNSYEILSTVTYQDKVGDLRKSVITTKCDILRVTDEGDDAGDPVITVNADELELI